MNWRYFEWLGAIIILIVIGLVSIHILGDLMITFHNLSQTFSVVH